MRRSRRREVVGHELAGVESEGAELVERAKRGQEAAWGERVFAKAELFELRGFAGDRRRSVHLD